MSTEEKIEKVLSTGLSCGCGIMMIVVGSLVVLLVVGLLSVAMDKEDDNAERATSEHTEIVNTPRTPADAEGAAREDAASEHTENSDKPAIPNELTGPVTKGLERGVVPPDVREKIKERAYDEHPHHITKRKVYIEAEMAAYEWIHTFSDPLITEEELRVFKRWVAKQYPDTFTQQNIALGMFRDRKHVENFNPPGIPPDVIEKMLEISYDRFPGNFSEQLYHLEEEAAAYEWLQNFRDPLITEKGAAVFKGLGG